METNLVQIFNTIRDIPYRIPLSAEEVDHCCTGKNKQLKALLEKQGLSVRWRVCTFRWRDIPLPVEVSEVTHADNSTHAYLEVDIDGEWRQIDATWDGSLSKLFSIAQWDGVSDTTIAVPCLDIYSPEESAKIIADESLEVVVRDLEINGEFYSAFNAWLEQARSTAF